MIAVEEDRIGKLYLFNIDLEEIIGKKKYSAADINMELKFLGESNIVNNLTYLNNKFVFMGSSFDDSQLI